MENTLENKAKFFAQYWGQKVLRYVNHTIHPLVDCNVLDINMNNLKHSWLELTPLSQITDEDAVEVAKAINPKFTFNENNVVARFKDFVTVTNGNYRIKIGFKVDILNKGFVLTVDGKVQSMYAYEAMQFYKTLIGLGYYVGDGKELNYGWVKLKSN